MFTSLSKLPLTKSSFRQVEIKKAEPRDGSGGNSMSNPLGGYGKMGNDGNHWAPHHGTPMNLMQGPNGQMGGPPLNMPLGGPMPGEFKTFKCL